MKFKTMLHRFGALMLALFIAVWAVACRSYPTIESLYSDKMLIFCQIDYIKGKVIIVNIGSLSIDPPGAAEAPEDESDSKASSQTETSEDSLLSNQSSTIDLVTSIEESSSSSDQLLNPSSSLIASPGIPVLSSNIISSASNISTSSVNQTTSLNDWDSSDSQTNVLEISSKTASSAESDIEKESLGLFYSTDEKACFSYNKNMKLYVQRGEWLYETEFSELKPKMILQVHIGATGRIYQATVLEDYKPGKAPQIQNTGSDNANAASGKTGTAETVYNYAEIIKNAAFSTTTADKNALRLEKEEIKVINVSVQKPKGDSTSANNSLNFGQNAGMLVHDGASVVFNASNISTNPKNSPALFIYGNKTSLRSDSAIISSAGSNSPALIVAGGANASFDSSNIQARNEGAPAIILRSLGVLSLKNSTVRSATLESPAVIIEGKLDAEGCDIASGPSEVLQLLPGANATFKDCTLSGTKEDYNDITNRELYSVSLSAKGKKTARLSLIGGELERSNHDMFRFAGGKTELVLDSVKIGVARRNMFRMVAGAEAKVCLKNLSISGNIDIDNDCSLELIISENATYLGVLGQTATSAPISLTLQSNGKFLMMGDCYLAQFSGDLAAVTTNGHRLFVEGKQVK